MSTQEKVMATIEASTVGDYDQRSALGMARSWVENGDDVKCQTYFVEQFKGRDDLAKALVDVMKGEDRNDCIAALQEARAVVNAPFIDASMLGWQAAREKRGMIGSAKKTEKMAGV